MKFKFLSPVGFGLMSCLLAQLMMTPVYAAKKSMAIVPVLPANISVKDQELLPQAIKEELQTKHKMTLADEQAVSDYFNQESQGSSAISEGDQHYIEAKQSYLQFNNNDAAKSIQLALNQYAINPGTQGGFFQAYLLQALMEDEKGESAKAKKGMENAIAHNLMQTELTDTFFSPRFRQMFKTVREGYLKNHEVTQVRVQVAGANTNHDIFMNGVPVGHGPEVILQAMPEQILYLQAGTQGKLYQTKPRASADNHIKIRSQLVKNKNASDQAYGFSSQIPNVAKEAQWLGQTVKTSKVVLLATQKLKGSYDVGVSVVDSQSGKLTEAKHFELNNFKNDSLKVGALIAQYLTSLEKNDYVEVTEDSMPIVMGQKKSNALLLGVLGGVLVAGVSSVVLLSGSSSSNPNSGVDVDLPPDSVDHSTTE